MTGSYCNLIFRRNSCLRALISIPDQIFGDLVVGRSWRGKPEILENAYKYCRYVTAVTGLDTLSLGELGGEV